MAPQALLTDLRVLNISVRVDGDTIRCKPPAGVSIPDNLAERIRAQKPELLELLRNEESEIAWRVETIGDWLIAPGAEPMPGTCSYCGLATPRKQAGKCVLCCLASAELLERKTQASYPTSVENGADWEIKKDLRDMSADSERSAA
jgi:hypothetical protein